MRVLVIGAGDATGGAIARRFAREGYIACMTRRNADKLAPVVDAIVAAGGTGRAKLPVVGRRSAAAHPVPRARVAVLGRDREDEPAASR